MRVSFASGADQYISAEIKINEIIDGCIFRPPIVTAIIIMVDKYTVSEGRCPKNGFTLDTKGD